MVISINCKTRFQILSMSNDKSEITRNMDSVENPSKSLPAGVEEENRRNEEVVEVVVENISKEIWRGKCNNETKRKRGRPSEKDKEEKDKEGLPESKKVKKSPRKKKNLNNAKPNGFNKLFKK